MMDLVKQEDVIKVYTEAVRMGRKYLNCFFSVEELKDKLEKQKITAYKMETALLIVEKGEEINNLLFICVSWDWVYYIEEIKAKHQPLVLSMVQTTELTDNLPFLKNGYSVYKIYQRLRRTEEVSCDNKAVITDYCTKKDRERLKELMYNTFDSFSDHIPEEGELDELIGNENIICLRMDNTVAGFIIFEDKGQTSYIRMVCIDSRYRGKGLGNKLMDTYLRLHKDKKSFTLWYDIENVAAYSLYCKWGYEKEKMYNLIFVF